MPKLDVGYSSLRSGVFAVILHTAKERVYFHFGTSEQAQKAILKVEHCRTTEEIKDALKKLSGGDYFCPSEESARNWESWSQLRSQSRGTHSS